MHLEACTTESCTHLNDEVGGGPAPALGYGYELPATGAAGDTATSTLPACGQLAALAPPGGRPVEVGHVNMAAGGRWPQCAPSSTLTDGRRFQMQIQIETSLKSTLQYKS